MKRSKYSDEQILAIVNEGEVRRHGAERNAAAQTTRRREPPLEAHRR